MKLNLPNPIEIGESPVMLKLKVKGKGMFFGEASSRVEKKEFEGVTFTFEDPSAFVEPDV
jgi:hypothetical protein